MSHHAHLPKFESFFAPQGHQQRTSARPAAIATKRCHIGTLLLGLLLLTCSLFQSAWAQTCPPAITEAHVAQELAGTTDRPTQGWQPTTLPDDWTRRWPGYNGGAWYRIPLPHGCTAATKEPIALFVPSINMAGEVYLNDTLLWRDASLQEPLSRSWNMPRYWVLPQAALQAEGNAIWIRVQGKALVHSGLGMVWVGPAAQLRALHDKFIWAYRSRFEINLVGTLFIAGLFAGIWLLYRKQALHGWYALLNLAWSLFIYNTVATDPWPLRDVAGVVRANAIAFMVFCTCYAMFTTLLQGRSFLRGQKHGLPAMTLGLSLLVVLMPESHLEFTMNLACSTHMLVFVIASIVPLFHAWRSRRTEDVFYAFLGLGFLCIAVVDAYSFFSGNPVPRLLMPYANLITMVVITALLGARIAASMRRTERFNVELRAAVEQACRELETTMGNEHQLALSNARLQQRLQFIHDLHDGFGSALVRAIIQAEHSAETHAEASRHVSTLKSLRDDLRNVMDGGRTAQADTPETPAEWMAPTRHRFSTLFDELDMTSHWSCLAAWPRPPSVALCMELTRLLEEALSNVLKHSAATEVEISLTEDARGVLTLEVRDNGVGFDIAAMGHETGGIGLSSMHARVARLGGQLELESRPGHSLVRASIAA
ncbi:ATP-binding protein [Acidovorax sp. CCYZU-2555]|uniref:sensor histidine kinase n=1 Tax=Acidovorax sp. CCYZU-2555 TaxID=2835042 RepID=UPI001BD04E17|nr:ATP-binding protein [Acidovorax sp. CCYZU-2555]MBS7777556.1 histidine kinase [Acidovorax sp. CCYZU-2555]